MRNLNNETKKTPAYLSSYDINKFISENSIFKREKPQKVENRSKFV
jgi:hypothetical protein